MNAIIEQAKDFRAFLPSSYRRRDIRIVAAESVTLYDLNWSGGTRNVYIAYEMTRAEQLGDSGKWNAVAPWKNVAEGMKLPIPAGACVVQTGYVCGKDALATIYVNPNNMPKLL